ncbi:MAG: hypothetical protein IJ667_07135 [Synergistaceae bacterium]|nr:hypothetical protein [Synergistaceae bacterium]
MANTVVYQLKHDIEANWTTKNPILRNGEPGYDMTANRLKFGTGNTAWNDLPYVAPDVVNDLTTGGADKALSAEQGKALKTLIDNIPDGVTYNPATQTTNGLMSAADKKKLDGIATGATAVSIVNNLTSTSTTAALSAAQGKELKTQVDTKLNSSAVTSETWTFTLSSGSTVTKKVAIM